MKLINADVIVETSAVTKWSPHLIEWNGSLYTVERIVDYWKVETDWWGKTIERLYVIAVTDGGVMELYRERNLWKLARLYD